MYEQERESVCVLLNVSVCWVSFSSLTPPSVPVPLIQRAEQSSGGTPIILPSFSIAHSARPCCRPPPLSFQPGDSSRGLGEPGGGEVKHCVAQLKLALEVRRGGETWKNRSLRCSNTLFASQSELRKSREFASSPLGACQLKLSLYFWAGCWKAT